MVQIYNSYQPEGRLIPVFSAHEDLAGPDLTVELARAAAARGETTLLLDVAGGEIMEQAGIIVGVTLGDVLFRNFDIKDAKYVSCNEHFTAASAGDATLEDLLGSLAALSITYDWVFVGVEHGCTPAHVRLAGAADAALLAFSGAGDKFMRAYWMLEAVRARSPRFDPLLMVEDQTGAGFEAFALLSSTINEFLGAAPPLGGIYQDGDDLREIAPILLEALDQDTIDRKRAVGC